MHFVTVFFLSLNNQNHKIMKTYKVVKPFFKLSDKKNYNVGDTIELSEQDAKALDWYVVAETKSKK